jgi:SAM-dependent MidA family methyltransferase
MNEHAFKDSSAPTLAGRLRDKIRLEGPISFRDWMAAALYDPLDGYYSRRDRLRWGRAGDYRTSPECSPLFAAAFAGYFASLYEASGAPDSWTILEAGAGAGHFALGVLETLERDYRSVSQATRYVIDEVSEEARERARKRLSHFGGRVTFRRLCEIGTAFDAGVVFSNELLDAFPVHRVTLRDGCLKEFCVGLDSSGAFKWFLSEPTDARLETHFDKIGIKLGEGQIAEVNLAAEDWLARAAQSLARGYLVLVDYGAEAAALYDATRRPAGSLRAFRQHRLSEDVLARPGAQDITTTVNWTQIRQAGERAGLRTVLHCRQDEFLLRAGLLEQLERMSAALQSEAARIALRVTARDMILPGGMSQSFQVLVLKKCADGRASLFVDQPIS